MKESLLPGEDANVTSLLKTSFEKQGIAVKTETVVQSLSKSGAGWNVHLSDGDSLTVEAVLSCVAAPRFKRLGLETAGIQLDKGRIKVDSNLRTSNPHVWAIGMWPEPGSPTTPQRRVNMWPRKLWESE